MVWVVLEWPKNSKIRRPKVADAAAFAGLIRARPAAVDKVASPCSSSLASACNKGMAGNVSHGQNPFGLKTGRNDPIRTPQVLRNFCRVFVQKMSVLALSFYLACKTRFI